MIEFTSESSNLLIRPNASMIMAHSDSMKNTIKTHISKVSGKGQPCKQVIMDLSKVDYMDSTGVGILISINNFSQEIGHSFKVIKPNALIKRVLTITKMYDLIIIED